MPAPMTIHCETIKTLCAICAGLTEQGHGYNAEWSMRRACWIITLSGAF